MGDAIIVEHTARNGHFISDKGVINTMKETRHHTVEEFENLFLNQAGYGLAVYHGQPTQRGYGLGKSLLKL